MNRKDRIFLLAYYGLVILLTYIVEYLAISKPLNITSFIILNLLNVLLFYSFYYEYHFVINMKSSTYEKIKVTDDLVSEFEDSIRIENMIGNMSDDEFYSFISTDRYGGDNADVGAILNLLEKIKSIPMYESKEKIIYKKLKEIRQ